MFAAGEGRERCTQFHVRHGEFFSEHSPQTAQGCRPLTAGAEPGDGAIIPAQPLARGERAAEIIFLCLACSSVELRMTKYVPRTAVRVMWG